MDLRDGRNNVPAGPSDTVFIDQNTPTTGGVVFDPNTPALTDTLYVSTTNGSTWIYNGSAYTTYTAPAVEATPFYVAGTTIDAGSNKKAIIERSGEVRVKNSTIAKIKTISGTRSLLLSSYVSSRNEILSTGDQLWLGTSDNNPFYLRTNGVERLRALGTGAIRFNQAYSFPTTDGTVGQALKTDGAGVISFGDVSMPSGVLGISNSSGVYTYYTTLTLAMAAATSGQTIIFFTDITETSNVEITLKDGVDINFNGYTYTLNTSGTANCFLANIANGRTRFYNGKIQRLGGTVSNVNSCVILVNNATVAVYNLDFNGVEIYSSFGVGITGNNNTVPKINGVKIRTFSHGCYFNVGVQINNSFIETFGGGVGCYSKTITNSYVVTTGGGDAIALSSSGSTASNCYASVSGVGSGRAFSCVSGSTITNCTAISTRNSAIYNFGANSIFTYAYSTAGAGFEAGTSTRGSVTNCYAYTTAGNAYLYNSEIANCYGESTSSYAIDCLPSGNVYNSTMKSSANAAGFRMDRCIGNTFISTYNNAAGHALIPYASALISNNTFIVTNVGANCIYSAGAISVKYANNAFIGSTTGVNANVSQSVTNTHDNQGNILM